MPISTDSGLQMRARRLSWPGYMDIKRVTPEEARQLAQDEGYVLVDVRSVPEYDAGHPDGAYNIPFLHKTDQGMVPNESFAEVVAKAFPDPETRIITSCQMGGRSLRAAMELKNRGYRNLMDMRGGFGGERDGTGAVVVNGWSGSGLPVELGASEGRSYEVLEAKTRVADAVEDHPASPTSGSGASDASTSSEGEGVNRFSHASRKVECVVLKKKLPGLKRRPYPGELGIRIYESVSAAAWDRWVEHSKMIINEYRIDSTNAETVKTLMEQCEKFLFGGDVVRPEGYVPESH
jgi:Fe-S cluster biosynthesis and repair protein YggX/rhodanese-related sulfurtransferase